MIKLYVESAFPGVDEKLAPLWFGGYLGRALLEIPQPQSCGGVAPQGLNLGVLNHSLS